MGISPEEFPTGVSMTSLELDNVSVDYMIRGATTGFAQTVRSMAVGGMFRKAHGQYGVSALRDISLSLEKGDRIGLIGHNGAGKTTMLKVMAGILPPTEGRVRIEGRISALLSVHLGLNPEASGYDNIRFRARLMGHDETEIEERQAEIADFTELGDYLRLPMRTYSGGMRLRLAFAISTAFEPDILILDEWLSAGDDSFRQKATDRLNRLIERTGIVVFASHNPSMQKRVCSKGILLSGGEIVFYGDIEEALEKQQGQKNSGS